MPPIPSCVLLHAPRHCLGLLLCRLVLWAVWVGWKQNHEVGALTLLGFAVVGLVGGDGVVRSTTLGTAA